MADPGSGDGKTEPPRPTDSTSSSNHPSSESAIYDRQIRLWGADAQAKISKSHVLFIHCTGVVQEMIKNLVLAGVRATLYDPRPHPDALLTTPCCLHHKEPQASADNANDDDKGSDNKRIKFASVAHALRGAVEELNPLLGTCSILTQDGSSDKDDFPIQDLAADQISKFNVIVASQIDIEIANQLVEKIQSLPSNGRPALIMADCFGWNGAALLDLGGPDYTYRPEVGKDRLGLPQTLGKAYTSLSEIWNVPLKKMTKLRIDRRHPPLVWIQYRATLHYKSIQKQAQQDAKQQGDNADFPSVVQTWLDQQGFPDVVSKSTLQQWAKVSTAEIAPVCAVVGGLLGNEVVKIISSKGEPANNVLIFDGFTGKCRNLQVRNQETRKAAL